MFGPIKEALSNITNEIITTFTNNKSDIYVKGGSILVVIGTIVSCTKTLKCEEILEEHREIMSTIHKVDEIEPEYRPSGDMRHDTYLCYRKTAIKMVCNFASGAALVGTGLYFIAKGYDIVKTERDEYIAAYNGLMALFNSYRDRNKELLGDNEEKKLYLESSRTDNSSENEKYDENSLIVPFKSGNPNWYSTTKYGPDNMWYNNNFLKIQSNWLKQIKESKGYIMMIDICEALHISEEELPDISLARKIGQKATWAGGKCDDIFEVLSSDVDAELHQCIWLKIKVDGVIINQLNDIIKSDESWYH